MSASTEFFAEMELADGSREAVCKHAGSVAEFYNRGFINWLAGYDIKEVWRVGRENAKLPEWLSKSPEPPQVWSGLPDDLSQELADYFENRCLSYQWLWYDDLRGLDWKEDCELYSWTQKNLFQTIEKLNLPPEAKIRLVLETG